MKYEIIVLDDESIISDESLNFVRKLQQFMELNFKNKDVSLVSVSKEYTVLSSDPSKLTEVKNI